jgi:hypothetical protein
MAATAVSGLVQLMYLGMSHIYPLINEYNRLNYHLIK